MTVTSFTYLNFKQTRVDNVCVCDDHICCPVSMVAQGWAHRDGVNDFSRLSRTNLNLCCSLLLLAVEMVCKRSQLFQHDGQPDS